MPPRFGKLNIGSWSGLAPTINGYKTDTWTLKQVQILNLAFEVDDLSADNLIPPAMHPVIPAYATFTVASCPESAVGRFTMAEVRVMGRAGVRPRGFALRTFIDNEAAGRELAARWGYPVAPGEVHLTMRHDRVQGRVVTEGRVALEIELLDRDAISGGDIQYVASMHLARNQQDQQLGLVQVDPEYTFSKAERGKPNLIQFDRAAWRSGEHLKFTNPISATFAVCDMTLPKIRYVCDPNRPALQGTTKVAA